MDKSLDSLSSQRIGSNRSQVRHWPTNPPDASLLNLGPLRRQNLVSNNAFVQQELREEIEPILKSMRLAICNELERGFPYLTNVIYQLKELEQHPEAAKALLGHAGVALDESNKLNVVVQTLESKHINAFNKTLQEDNARLQARAEELQEQIRVMRRNFNRDLNNRETQQIHQKRKLAKLEEKGLFNLGSKGEDMDVNAVKFFDVSDGLDREVLEMLNEKVLLIKTRFQTW